MVVAKILSSQFKNFRYLILAGVYNCKSAPLVTRSSTNGSSSYNIFNSMPLLSYHSKYKRIYYIFSIPPNTNELFNIYHFDRKPLLITLMYKYALFWAY